MSELGKVSQLLAARFEQEGERGRIVFWEDAKGQYAGSVAALVGEDASEPILRGVKLVEVGHTPFSLRYRMMVENPDAKFLVYMPGDQPEPKDDWLLDLKLAYGPSFSADKLTMIANEVFPAASTDTKAAWLAVMRRLSKFFESSERVERLCRRLTPNDDATDFQAKMVASLLKLPVGSHSMQDIWRALLEQYAKGDESGMESITAMGLADFHWQGTKGIYHYDLPEHGTPTAKGFMLWLFDLAWHGFVTNEHTMEYYGNIRRDYMQWSMTDTSRDIMRQLADMAEPDLDVDAAIAGMDLDALADHGVFRSVDETVIAKLMEQLSAHGIDDRQVRDIIAKRRSHLWFREYDQRYQAVSTASMLQHELTEAVPLIDAIDSPAKGIESYSSSLYRVDQAYRHFVDAWQVMELEDVPVKQLLENDYSQFQRNLGRTWQQQVDTLDRWTIPGFDKEQWRFYENHVAERTRNGHKIAVIVSDALRYEVAEELSRNINAENRFHAQIEANVGVLPSYTQLGMAALLPHSTLELNTKDHYSILVDGKSATGTEARDHILASVGGRAIQAKDFMALSGSDARELMKSCDVLYVYHDTIDDQGDRSENGELKTFTACRTALHELQTIVKKLANANVTNMIVTADHGFLYQDHDLEPADFVSKQPQGDACWFTKKRFAIGCRLVPDDALVTFNAHQLGLANPPEEGVTVQMPNSILRFHTRNAGTRFAHGGAALQEIVVPVIHIKKGRTDSGDARQVTVRILQKGERITSGQITVEFLQEEPVGGKVQARTLYAALWGGEGDDAVQISNEVRLVFQSEDPKIENRHVFATLVLTSDASQFNGVSVELRLREPVKNAEGRFTTLPERARYQLRRGLVADDGFDF